MLRKTGIAALVLVAIVGVLAVWQKDKLLRLRAVTTLFAEDRIVENFSSMDAMFETVAVPVKGTPQSLPKGRPMALPDDWQPWLKRRSVTGVIVLRRGVVTHESYHLGTKPDDLRVSWSLAKSYLSALIGVLLEQGDIKSIDDPVTDYAPALIGSAYDGVSIRNVLQMSSGVVFDEDALDFWSDINRMGRILALGGSMDEFAASLTERYVAPGYEWEYVSIDTHVLGMVARGATNRTLADLLGQHILSPLGTQGAPYYVSDGYGVAFALGGLNLTLHDYAKIGELYRLAGMFQGRRVVPEDWIAISTVPQANTKPGKLQYGYQWWIPVDARDGEFLARGVYGQYVYIDRRSETVVAVTAADRAFGDDDAFDDALQMLRKITSLE